MTAVQTFIFPERQLITTISVVETLQESVLSHVLTWKATASCSQWVQFAETCSGRQDVVTCLSKTNSLSHSNYLCVVDPLVLVFRILVKNRPYVSRFVCNDAVFLDLLYVGWESEVFGYMYFTSRWQSSGVQRPACNLMVAHVEFVTKWKSDTLFSEHFVIMLSFVTFYWRFILTYR
jgi:hypothetical protein